MSRLLWLADVLADEFRGDRGFRVETVPGWEARGGIEFEPDHVMDHHTGPGAYDELLAYMAEGPVHPPLCNIATSRPDRGAVRITVIAAGRANHAGKGEYPGIPLDRGNVHCIGCEHQNDGQEPWPTLQVEAMRRVAAALLFRLGRDERALLDHKQYAPTRKTDRHSMDLETERAAVARLLAERRAR